MSAPLSTSNSVRSLTWTVGSAFTVGPLFSWRVRRRRRYKLALIHWSNVSLVKMIISKFSSIVSPLPRRVVVAAERAPLK